LLGQCPAWCVSSTSNDLKLPLTLDKSWAPQNFYNLWQRTASPRSNEITFNSSDMTLFQQRWRSKAMVRAYHGDYIPEKIFKRWYLPDNLPDVRPKKVVIGDDKTKLEEFAKRKQKEEEYESDEKKRGMAPVGSLMLAEVERRIDTVVFRACLAHSIYEARRLVVHGDVLLNGRKVRHFSLNFVSLRLIMHLAPRSKHATCTR